MEESARERRRKREKEAKGNPDKKDDPGEEDNPDVYPRVRIIWIEEEGCPSVGE